MNRHPSNNHLFFVWIVEWLAIDTWNNLKQPFCCINTCATHKKMSTEKVFFQMQNNSPRQGLYLEKWHCVFMNDNSERLKEQLPSEDELFYSFMKTSSNGNIFHVTGLLCGEFTGERWIPPQRPVMQSFDVFFDLPLNRQLNKQWRRWWFETLPCSLWLHCDAEAGWCIFASTN